MSAVLDGARTDVPGWDDVVAAGLTTADAFSDRAAEHAALRAVAARDLGLARVLDGHRNALERLLRHRPGDVSGTDRAVAGAGLVPHGVWGADPRPDERPVSEPAALDPDGTTVSGVKVFCSGAGLVQRALVLVRPGSADDRPAEGLRGAVPPVAGRRVPPAACVLLDVSDPDRATVDRDWWSGDALRSSASHRVVLDRAPVLATLTPPPGTGALLEEPWFSGDALRTAVTWAGALDAVVDGTTDALRARGISDAEAVLLTRAYAARASVDRWLDHATAVRDAAPADARRTVLLARVEITERCREALRACAELTGSHPMAVGAAVARARADLDLLLLQHRLTPAVARLGHDLLSDA